MSNYLNKELTGKVVNLIPSHFKEGIKDHRFMCEDGFGCNAFTNGTKIYGYWLEDNAKDCISGYDVLSLCENK